MNNNAYLNLVLVACLIIASKPLLAAPDKPASKVLLGALVPAVANEYRVIEIDDGNAVGGYSPNDINNNGQVTGYLTISGHYQAFLWSQSSGMRLLGGIGTDRASVANGINDVGQVAGESFPAPYNLGRAFLWTASKGMSDIGTLGGEGASASGINNNGAICGVSFPPNSHQMVPFLWTESEGMRDLGTLSGGGENYVRDVNDSKKVVGSGGIFSGEQHAFLWTEETGIFDLGTLPNDTISQAEAINNSGTVVGLSGSRAFLWRIGTMFDLGKLDNGYTVAYDINDHDQVVGESSERAFIWQNGKMIDLNNLIPPDSNWNLQAAISINDKGWIVGNGIHNGSTAGFLLIPTTLAPLTSWLAGVTTANQPSKATFKIGVTADGGLSFGSTFDASQKIDVLADIRVAPEHVGKKGRIYMVALYNDVWFMKASNGQWQNWDFQLASLVSSSGPRTLKALESLTVAPQLSGLAGKFWVYVGYKVASDIHYNAQAVGFTVKEMPVMATAKLNDTGITTCAYGTTNGLACPQSTYPGQDAQFGRDATHNDNSDGHAGFSFTKISSTGKPLAASASSWNCVKDNVTGLMWEIKTDDNGLHDKDWGYTWYEPDNTQNGGNPGTQDGGSCGATSPCDTYAYVQAVNAAGWCGVKDWRMPTVEELRGITAFDRSTPAIDTAYFPNTLSTVFWSSSSYAVHGSNAWLVDFKTGRLDDWDLKKLSSQVRLVRSGQ